MTNEPTTVQPSQDETANMLMDILTELCIIRFCLVPKNATGQADEVTICQALRDAAPALERAGKLSLQMKKERRSLDVTVRFENAPATLDRRTLDELKKSLVDEINHQASTP